MSLSNFDVDKKSQEKGQRKRGRPVGSKSSNVAGEVTRAKLIDVSLELFSRKGFAGVSIGAVSEASGVAKGSITHHFPNKKHLYQTVLEVVGDGVRSACHIAFDTTYSLRDRLDNLVEGIIAWSHENEAQARMVAFELLGMSERGEKAPKWVLNDHLEATTSLLKAGQTEEILVDDCSSLTLLEVIFGLAVFSAIHRPNSRQKSCDAAGENIFMKEAQDLLKQSIFKSR